MKFLSCFLKPYLLLKQPVQSSCAFKTRILSYSFLSEVRHNSKMKDKERHHFSSKFNAAEDISDEKTHFGNETVTRSEKAEKVHNVFENVASKYDLMNDAMSAGIHRVWKNIFVSRLNPTPGMRLLDAAGGTGDITFKVLQYIHNEQKLEKYGEDRGEKSSRLVDFEEDIYSPEAHRESKDIEECKITVCDISEEMLRVGQDKALKLGLSNIQWVCGDAQKLPFPDRSFDAYTIAYGIRNVVDIQKALDEAYRVLKPGGRFLCLEFSQVNNSLIRSVYDLYSFQVIPVMGQIIAGDWESYQYLVESIRKFPDQETFKAMIENAGFRCVTYENLTFGVTAIHSGFKI